MRQSELEDDLVKLAKDDKLQHTIIIALFEGNRLPRYCASMPREPAPESMPFKDSFLETYFSALGINHSFQDGVIMIQAGKDGLKLRGFSYRVYPPSMPNLSRPKNKGSAFNSALDFSCVNRVKCTYIVSKEGVRKSVKGDVTNLC